MIKIIAAVGKKNRVIGCNGKIPWHLRTDLIRFKKLTVGNTVIMGRKTFESLNCLPLPQRINIIISHSLKSCEEESYLVVSSPQEALKKGKELNKDIFIIGGQSIYESFLPLSEQIILTVVEGNFSGDSFFPDINHQEWHLASSSPLEQNKGDDFPFFMEIYNRIS